MKIRHFLTTNTRAIAIGIFVIVVLITRLAFLGTLPHGMHIDEASFLLNSVSIMESGRDEDNVLFPATLESNLDPKPALYSYLQVPFIALFGPTTFASRLPSFVLSVLSLALIWMLLKKWLSAQHRLLVMGFLLMSPWHIMVSRGTQEVILSFVLSLCAVFCFEKLLSAQDKKSLPWWILGFAASVLSAMYTYHSAKVFLPLLFAGFIALTILPFFNEKASKVKGKVPWSRLAIAGCIPFLMLFLSLVLFSESSARFSTVSVFSNTEPQLLLEEQIRTGTGEAPTLLLRAFYNKPMWYAQVILSNYLLHLSPQFLFFHDSLPTRYIVPYVGLFYIVELALIPIGAVLALKNSKKNTWIWPVLCWTAVAPVAAALTYQEIPNSIRTFPLVLPLTILSAYGVYGLWQLRKNTTARLGLVLLAGVAAQNVAFFGFQFMVQQPNYQPWHRNLAAERLMDRITEISPQYENLNFYIETEMYAYLALRDASVRETLRNTSFTRQDPTVTLQKYHFLTSQCSFPLPTETKNDLYIFPADCPARHGMEVQEYITFKDNVKKYALATFDLQKAIDATKSAGIGQ